MVQACKKVSEGDWMVVISRPGTSTVVSSIRGAFKTKKCAQAEARRARKKYPGSTFDVIKRVEIPAFLEGKSKASRKKACYDPYYMQRIMEDEARADMAEKDEPEQKSAWEKFWKG